MKFKTIGIIFMLLITSYVTAQDKITYKRNGIFMRLLDDSSGSVEVVANKPIGKNVTIVHDTFFKSYLITFTNSNSSSDQIELEFIKEDEEGRSVVKDHFGARSVVFSNLETGGMFLLQARERANGYAVLIVVE
jgi:hypothetical protein